MLGGKDRMAGGEDQPQQVVVDVLVEHYFDVGRLAFQLGKVVIAAAMDMRSRNTVQSSSLQTALAIRRRRIRHENCTFSCLSEDNKEYDR